MTLTIPDSSFDSTIDELEVKSKLLNSLVSTFFRFNMSAKDKQKNQLDLDFLRQALGQEVDVSFASTEADSKPEAEKYIETVSEEPKKALGYVPTNTFLDNLFLDENYEHPLGGIPVGCQLGIVGISGSGKSILTQEVVLQLANQGYKVTYCTTEDIWATGNDRFDLQSRLAQKAEILGFDWNKIRENLIVLDVVQHTELRDWQTFIRVYKYVAEKLGSTIFVVDSLTLLETGRGSIKYRLLELSRYNQRRGITAIYVSQRAEEESDKFSMSGGIGVAHILDSVICIDFGKAMGELKETLKVKQWDMVHFARMLSCRLTGFDRGYKKLDTTKDGFLKAVPVE